MKINELENHLYEMILNNWGNIEEVYLTHEREHILTDISDCEGEFWCEKNKIKECLFVKIEKMTLNLEDFFSDKWGIKLVRKAQAEVRK